MNLRSYLYSGELTDCADLLAHFLWNVERLHGSPAIYYCAYSRDIEQFQ
jgi:hypothetical protein